MSANSTLAAIAAAKKKADAEKHAKEEADKAARIAANKPVGIGLNAIRT